MNHADVTHKNLNNGKETLICFPLSTKEFEDQVSELFEVEHYKEGRVKDGVYVDLGANIGLTALYFKDYARKYYAIEPSSQCFEALKLNTQGMDINYFNMAITPHNGKEFLKQTAKDSIPQTFFPLDNDKIYSREEVQCKSIDKFFEENKIEHVDVLKIDVEGSEFAIFPDDSFKKVADKIDLIIGESHYAKQGGMPEFVPIILKDYGFKTRFVELSRPNMIRNLFFTDVYGKEKKYDYVLNTIFLAKR